MKTKTRLRERLRRGLRRELWLTLGPILLVIAAAFAVTILFVKPAPPKKLVLALSPDEGGSRYYAKKYKESLAKHGITLELRETPGSGASVSLLTQEEGDVDVALVVGGIDAKTAPDVASLGSISYVPLWIFTRDPALTDPAQLRGKRISVGPADSSTRTLAIELLHLTKAEEAPTELLPLGRDEAIAQLEAGKVDAIVLVSPAEAPAVQKLAAKPGIHLMSIDRAPAYSRRLTHLAALDLPRGVFNLAADVPAADVKLLSPTAHLVARESLHPALAYLLLRAASEVHGSAGLLDRSGEFPAPRETGLPLSDEARRYYASGVPLLQRYLPFWAANLVDRLWVMLVPLLAVLVPLVRAVPAIVRWRVRSRVFRWYGRLKELELQLEEGPGREALAAMLVRLEEIEQAVNNIPTPLAFADHLYYFREHLDVVRRRIVRRLEHDVEAPSAA